MNYSPLSIPMEASPGSDIADCFDQAINIAVHIGAVVTFDFNGVHCGVRPTDIQETLSRDWFLENFHSELRSKKTCKICYANQSANK